MGQKILDLIRGKAKWPLAMVIAAGSDALSFGDEVFLPVQLTIDFATALLLWAVLGFSWPLLAGLIIEAIPGAALFPTWVVAVGALMTVGVTPPSKLPPMTKKTLSREELASELARLRASGRKAVFTNGVFDLLHVGHLRYLSQARALGDALIIGLNSDASVRRLKGEKRPILPEAERAELLAGLSCVDYVCIFDEDDPRELIKAATPAVLVKGGDWKVEQILGRDTVEAAGGRVLSLPFVEGQSTTKIVESIAKRYGSDFKE
jgi:D-beta-D-heptose 7-phosphate kinase/D-beta-D-heptose 1-phosphate adenosyltransferase